VTSCSVRVVLGIALASVVAALGVHVVAKGVADDPPAAVSGSNPERALILTAGMQGLDQARSDAGFTLEDAYVNLLEVTRSHVLDTVTLIVLCPSDKASEKLALKTERLRHDFIANIFSPAGTALVQLKLNDKRPEREFWKTEADAWREYNKLVRRQVAYLERLETLRVEVLSVAGVNTRAVTADIEALDAMAKPFLKD